MAQPSATHFLETVERSGLVDRARLEEVLACLERETGPEALNDTHIITSQLTGRGLLTGWQSERLLEGRHRGFFLGKYKLLDHLGTGGMSSVYLAEHQLMRRRVAIKVLPTNLAEGTSHVRRFHREARAVASLDHPNVVRAFDVDQEGDVHFLVMEYVQGRDLKTLVEQEGRLPPRVAAEYMRQAAQGLACAHRLGLVHRDMKPANLIVDRHGTVKVLDLGLASVKNDIDGAITSEFDDKVLGTVDYLAPEQALNSHLVDGRADIYSLGCTLYFALIGRPPFGEGSLGQRIMAHQMRQPAEIRRERPEVPEGLVQICRKMMAKSPSARYQDMEAVASALAEWLRVPTTAAMQPTSADELRLAPLSDEKASTAQRGGSSPAASASAPQPAGRVPPSGAQPPRNKASTTPSPRPSPNQTNVGKAVETRSPPHAADPATLDRLLAELPPVARLDKATSPSAKLVRSQARPSTSPKRAGTNRWESPWFLIGIGAALGMLVIAVYFVLRFFFG